MILEINVRFLLIECEVVDRKILVSIIVCFDLRPSSRSISLSTFTSFFPPSPRNLIGLSPLLWRLRIRISTARAMFDIGKRRKRRKWREKKRPLETEEIEDLGINLLCNAWVLFIVLQDASVDRRIIWHHYNHGNHIAFVYIKIVFLCPWIFCETIQSRAKPCQPWSVFQ